MATAQATIPTSLASDRKILGLLTPTGAAMGGMLLLAFVLLFHRWFIFQHRHSSRALEDWGHAYIIPLISLYLLRQKQGELARLTPRAFWPGLVPMLVGIMSYFTCVVLVKNHMLQGFSIVLTLYGTLLLLLGPAMMRVMFVPVAYLVFGITISEAIMNNITFRLQLVASQMSEVTLSIFAPLFGFSVQGEGNSIEIITAAGQSYPLTIAEACAGLRMLIAFLALGVAVALVACRQWWQRIALVLLAIPVSLLMNAVRVTALGLLTLINPDLASGEAHTLIGTLLLVPALGLYMGVVWVLNRLVREPAATTMKAPKTEPEPMPRLRAPLVAALALLLASAGGMTAGIRAFNIYLAKLPIHAPEGRTLSNLPNETAHWIKYGNDRVESADVVETLGTSNYVSRLYVEKEPKDPAHPRMIDLHLAYYTGMIDTVPHVPDRCFIGGGMTQGTDPVYLALNLDRSRWFADPDVPDEMRGKVWRTRLADDRKYTSRPGQSVRLPRDPEGIRMRIMGFDAPGGPRVFAGYFFIANGGHTGSAQDVRALAFNLTDDYAYYLKVQCTSETTSAEELAAMSSELLGELLGEIMLCVPDWTEVQAGRYPPDNPRRDGADGDPPGGP